MAMNRSASAAAALSVPFPGDVLDLDAFRGAPLSAAPFEHVVLRDFVKPGALRRINEDYPVIGGTGSFPLDALKFGPAFQALIDALESADFRRAFEQKFGMGLASRPTTITVRGRCSPADGKIHNDSKSKIITVLLYLNAEWHDTGGRLRLLRSGGDLDDYAVEVPPCGGALVAFLRSGRSWHGHLPFSGERRVVQFNWVHGSGSRRLTILRHRLSAAVKRVQGLVRPRGPEYS